MSKPETSIFAYREILARLPGIRADVLRALLAYHQQKEHAPTAKELVEHSRLEECWKRLPELVKAGAAYKGEVRRCTVTGKRAATWIPGKEPEQKDLFD